MPRKKEPPRTRAEQERAFKEAAKASGADESGRAFESALGAVLKPRRALKMSGAKQTKR